MTEQDEAAEETGTAFDSADWLEQIGIGTMRGDIRDAMLNALRSGPLRGKAWGDLSQTQQVAVAEAINEQASLLVLKSMRVLQTGNPKAPEGKLVGLTGTDEKIVLKVAMARTDENFLALCRMLGSNVSIVSLDVRAMLGERRPVIIAKDQPDLPLNPREEQPQEQTDTGPDMEAINERFRQEDEAQAERLGEENEEAAEEEAEEEDASTEQVEGIAEQGGDEADQAGQAQPASLEAYDDFTDDRPQPGNEAEVEPEKTKRRRLAANVALAQDGNTRARGRRGSTRGFGSERPN